LYCNEAASTFDASFVRRRDTEPTVMTLQNLFNGQPSFSIFVFPTDIIILLQRNATSFTLELSSPV
jgi:hypothetical protein